MRKNDDGWLALALTQHLGGSKLRALRAAFGDDAGAVLTATDEALQAVRGIGPKLSAAIRALGPGAAVPVERWAAAGLSWALVDTPGYPEALYALEDPPALIVQRGVPALQDCYPLRLALVGTRTPSRAAEACAERIAYLAAARGALIVSGLALGIDTAAHRGALAAGGRTIAVLGGGVLKPYPPENRALADILLGCGMLLSEKEPYALARTPALVARNRIISALAQVLVVAETSVEGGAMHAARRALALGRPVFTRDTPDSGNQALLAAGAQPLAEDAEAALEQLWPAQSNPS
jgi:DNA processing protein